MKILNFILSFIYFMFLLLSVYHIPLFSTYHFGNLILIFLFKFIFLLNNTKFLINFLSLGHRERGLECQICYLIKVNGLLALVTFMINRIH